MRENFLKLVECFLELVEQGSLEDVQKMLSKVPSLALQPRSMLAAATRDNSDFLGVLLAAGANVDVTDPDASGFTPLIQAAAEGRVNNVVFLLNNKANLHKTNDNGSNALMLACRGPDGHPSRASRLDKIDEYIETVEVLISRGAKVNHQNHTGNTALMYAAMSGTVSYDVLWPLHFTQPSRHVIAKKLIEAGAKTTLKNQKGETALDISREHKTPEVEAILLGLNEEATQRLVALRDFNDGSFKNELEKAIDKRDLEEVRKFCSMIDKKTINARRKEYRSNSYKDYTIEHETILQYALMNGASMEILQALLEAGASPGKVALTHDPYSGTYEATIYDGTGEMSAIHFAVRYYPNARPLDLLLNYGADLNGLNNAKESALHYAVRYKKCEWIVALAKMRININLKNASGLTAIDEAFEEKGGVLVFCKRMFPDEDYSINRRDGNGRTKLHRAVEFSGWQCKTIDELLTAGASVTNRDDTNNHETIFTTLFYSLCYFSSPQRKSEYTYFLNSLRSLLKINGAVNELENGKNAKGVTALDILNDPSNNMGEKIADILSEIEKAKTELNTGTRSATAGVFSQTGVRDLQTTAQDAAAAGSFNQTGIKRERTL